jgi:hypothetical protein
VSNPDVPAGQIADAVAARVAGCPAVAALSAGPIATYLPGRAVTGVAVRDNMIVVSVKARFVPMADLVGQVLEAVRATGWELPVSVDVADIEMPGPPRQRSVQEHA